MTLLPHLYLSAEASGGLLGALGIDWKTLIFNALAFLIILGLLNKYIYPVLTKAIDKKADEMNAATKLAAEAQSELSEAETERKKVLRDAQKAADELLANAKSEAAETITTARARATTEADQIISSSRDQLEKDVAAARHTLRAETALLVAQATESITNEKLNSGSDSDLIKRAVEAKR